VHKAIWITVVARGEIAFANHRKWVCFIFKKPLILKHYSMVIFHAHR